MLSNFLELTQHMPWDDPELAGCVHINKFTARARREPLYTAMLNAVQDAQLGKFSHPMFDPYSAKGRLDYFQYEIAPKFRETVRKFAATMGNEFSFVHADLLNRELETMYQQAAPPALLPLFRRQMAKDLRKMRPGRVEGVATILPKVERLQNYEEGGWIEWYWEYQVYKYGEMIPWALEDQINDDLGFFDTLPGEMTQSVANTFAWMLGSQLYTATGWNTALFQQTAIQTFPDSTGTRTALGQGTVGTTALTLAANIETAMNTISEGAGYQSVRNMPFIKLPRYLVVGSRAMEIRAKGLLNSLLNQWVFPSNTTEAAKGTYNAIKDTNLQVIYDPMMQYIMGATIAGRAWGIFNENIPAGRYADLIGYEGPQLFLRNPDGDEAFRNDSRAMKIRMWQGATPLDPRCGWVSNGA